MITICLIIFAIVLCWLIYNFDIDKEDERVFEDIAKTVSFDDDDSNNDTEFIIDNSDCIGWVRIEDTKIDYPIMQTKNNPEYYLRRNINKEYSYIGTPFMDARCNAYTDNNLIVYGHNMRDGAMFAGLMKFKDYNYCKNHQNIYVKINGVSYKYTLFAVCKVNANDDWYNYTDQTDEETFNNLISHIKDKSLYFSNNAKYGDFFITLSTCEYSQTNGRLILIAKRSDDNAFQKETS
jgi:sortase B